MLAKLFFAWLLFRGRANSSEPGQGGITKQLTLKGRDGRSWHMTFFGDRTRLAETDKVAFYVRGSDPGTPIKVVKGDAAAIKDALANLPE
ncbi:MAG TPA: hypothetical protein VGJ91_17805 [Polyangiaceae bacterium]|jgi:hypothetical protein